MSQRDESLNVVVVCDPDGPTADAARAYLQQQGVVDARWFSPRDVDHLERELREGGTWRVIWPDVAGWLEAVWDGRSAASCWARPGVTVEFVADGTASASAAAPAIAAAWNNWRTRQRRRQAIVGTILSVIAVAAAFLILALSR